MFDTNWYILHHFPSIWGCDGEAFNPDRWIMFKPQHGNCALTNVMYLTLPLRNPLPIHHLPRNSAPNVLHYILYQLFPTSAC